MNGLSSVYAMIKADFLERTRRSTFLVILCLVIYLGYYGQHRGRFSSSWTPTAGSTTPPGSAA